MALCEYEGGQRADVMFRYIVGRVREAVLEDSYRDYVSTALYAQAQNKRLGRTWREIVTPRKPSKPPEQVLAEVIERTGLKIDG